MIPHLQGWTRRYQGEAIVLVPPEGPALGTIRYRESVTPLRRLRAIVEAALAAEPRFRAASVEKPRPIVTSEGEYGATLVATGAVAGVAAQHHVGVVFTDHGYDVITGLVERAEAFERFATAVTSLTTEDSLGLGVRRRRFWYDAPTRWQGLARGLATEWTPPGFPRDKALILVLPANPIAPSEQDQDLAAKLVTKALASQRAVDDVTGPFPAASAHGLSGSWWTVVARFPGGEPLRREIALLRDARHVYTLHVEAAESAHASGLAAFKQVVQSVRPLPPARRTPADAAELVRAY
jgi:hypothetical protein